MNTQLLAAALDAFDNANSADPNQEFLTDVPLPKELLYGQRMSEVLSKFAPEASEHLQLSARAQHIERWKSPRSDFPEGRAGYKKWRSQLSLFHAQRAGELMTDVGYSEEDVDRVKFLIQKRHLKRDPETQCLEDVACLVFLEYYFEEFTAKHSEEKIIDIVQKTWGKMSDKGQKAALKIHFPEKISNILQKSLA
ncbi:MAG: DUF4202 domain-containing protein [Agarilytica sp.]